MKASKVLGFLVPKSPIFPSFYREKNTVVPLALSSESVYSHSDDIKSCQKTPTEIEGAESDRPNLCYFSYVTVSYIRSVTLSVADKKLA